MNNRLKLIPKAMSKARSNQSIVKLLTNVFKSVDKRDDKMKRAIF